jgi:hypothetical protein
MEQIFIPKMGALMIQAETPRYRPVPIIDQHPDSVIRVDKIL